MRTTGGTTRSLRRSTLFTGRTSREISWKVKRGWGLRSALASASFFSPRRRVLEKHYPGEVASLVRRVRALDHLLRRLSLSLSSLDDPPPMGPSRGTRRRPSSVIALGFPVAVLGVVAWWIPYRLTGAIANRLPGRADSATRSRSTSCIAGVVLFPRARRIGRAAWLLGGPPGPPSSASFFPSQESPLFSSSSTPPGARGRRRSSSRSSSRRARSRA